MTSRAMVAGLFQVSRGNAGLRTRGPLARHRRWVGLCLPMVLLAAACAGDSEAGADGAAQGGDQSANAAAGSGAVTAGSSGAARGGSGGTSASMSSAGGSSSSSEGMGGSGPVSLAGAGGDMSMMASDGSSDAAPGETGIFVGMTAAHNAARAAEMTDPPLPDLTWSNDLAVIAQDWADTLAGQCGTIMHRMPNKYGENIAERGSTRLTTQYSPAEAVDSWMSEKACWDYGTINGTEQCDQACVTDLHSTGCGHYTQIVWRDTRRVGCGYSQCQDGDFTDEIWVCNYDPYGNIIGESPY